MSSQRVQRRRRSRGGGGGGGGGGKCNGVEKGEKEAKDVKKERGSKCDIKKTKLTKPYSGRPREVLGVREMIRQSRDNKRILSNKRSQQQRERGTSERTSE